MIHLVQLKISEKAFRKRVSGLVFLETDLKNVKGGGHMLPTLAEFKKAEWPLGEC